MFENYPDVLTVEQVMLALSVGKNTVYDLLHSKQLNSIRVGKRFIIPKIFLLDFINIYREKNNKINAL